MATGPTNLNKARKRRARLAAEASAAENRVKFGRTKAERTTTTLGRAADARRLDGHKIEDPGET